MRRRSIVEFEQLLAKQIADERAVLAKLEADVITSRTRIATLESVAEIRKQMGNYALSDDGKAIIRSAKGNGEVGDEVAETK